MDSIFGYLGVILLLAFLVETIVEALFGRVADHVPLLQPYRWLLAYVAVATGVIGAFVYGFDLLSLLGSFLSVEIALTVFGKIITGVAIGMGSAYIHQVISVYFPKKS